MSAASPCPTRACDVLAEIGKSIKIVPTSLEFVDIAGLVRGASKGEGLGNQFLANIREVDAIIHVLRCFEDSDITHVEGSIDPLRDIEVVETELMLSDLESLERRLIQAQKRARGGDKESIAAVAIMEPLVAALQEGKPARTAIPARRGRSGPPAATADLETGAVCLQRGGSQRRHGQCVLRTGARLGGDAGRAVDRRLRRDRGRGLAASGERTAAEFLEGLGLIAKRPG